MSSCCNSWIFSWRSAACRSCWGVKFTIEFIGWKNGYFFTPRIASLAALATRNFTTRLAAILMVSPVAGLRPIRALVLTIFTIPKSGNLHNPSFLVALITAAMVPSYISRDCGWVQPQTVRRLWRQHMTGAFNHSDRLWAILQLQCWLSYWGKTKDGLPIAASKVGSQPSELSAV